MDNNTKMQVKADLKMVQVQLGAIVSMVNSISSQIVYPLPTGGVLPIPVFTQVAQALKMQSEATDKLSKLVEKIIDQS